MERRRMERPMMSIGADATEKCMTCIPLKVEIQQ